MLRKIVGEFKNKALETIIINILKGILFQKIQ